MRGPSEFSTLACTGTRLREGLWSSSAAWGNGAQCSESEGLLEQLCALDKVYDTCDLNIPH